MTINIRILTTGLSLPMLLTSCFFDATGCTDDICINTSQESCTGDSCDDTLYCEDSALIEQRLAEIISTVRNKARNCGQEHYNVAGAVYWNAELASVALRHSTDMATNNFLSHTGSDGTSVVDRTQTAGYEYSLLAENIAGGQQTSTRVVTDWIDSSDHCANLMHPSLNEIGAACVKDTGSDYETYWTLVLASPKTP